MTDPKSRYYHLKNLTFTNSDGQEIVYKSRRILPQPEEVPSLFSITVERGQRLDQISAKTLGNPEFYWKIGDANRALNLEELERPNTRLRIPGELKP